MDLAQSKNTAHFSQVANNIPDFFVFRINNIANSLIASGEDVIKLNLGKSELPVPDFVINELVQKMYDRVQREIVDSQGLLPLREEIASSYNSDYGTKITAKQVFINNGTSPFFSALFLLLTDPGDEILFPRPYYPTYVASAIIAKAGSKFYEIKNGRVDLDSLKNNFVPGKTRAVFLNSPGNPFGNVLSREEIKEILNFVAGRAFIISDEIYDGFIYNGDFVSVLQLSDPARDKVILLNGFSKIHHMYTRRLGFVIVPEYLIQPLLKYQQHTVVCVDPVVQFGGLISLQKKETLIKEQIKDEVEEYKKRLELCRNLIERTKLKIIEPSGGFYVCVDVSAYLNESASDSLSLAMKIIEKIKVAVTPGEDFGRKDFFRVTLTSSRVVEGVERMCDYLKSL